MLIVSKIRFIMSIYNNFLSKYSGYLIELKKRVIFCLLFILFSSLLGYLVKDRLYNFLVFPLIANNFSGKLIYTELTEAFFTYCKISICFGIFVSIPVITFNIYRFISPALYKRERKIFCTLVFLSPFLFYLGFAFVNYLVMPKAWAFFLDFEKSSDSQSIDSIKLLLSPKINEYVDLVIKLILAFGFAFQLPVVLIVLVLIDIVSADTLIKKRRLAILINFVIAGVVTPPDVLSQLMLAIPMIFLYEFSIIITKNL